jgi:MoxR-like ATPase
MIIPMTNIPEAAQIPAFLKVMDDLALGNNVFLVGSAGTGKTTLAEKVAYARVGRAENDGDAAPFVTISCSQWTSPTDIRGGQTIEGYKEGALIEAWKYGYTLIIDEMPKLDANTAGILNDPLAKSAKDGAVIFNGLNQPIKKHPNFGCIATGNVIGKGASGNYVGNNKQDSSLLDRFSSCIYHIGFNEALERQLIYAPLVTKCLEIRRAILRYESKEQDDDNTDDIMTLRTMINLQRAYELEMMREVGLPGEDGKPLRKVEGGKTLRDGFESYFMVLSSDKAQEISQQVNMEGFYNSYRGGEMKEGFKTEYKKMRA